MIVFIDSGLLGKLCNPNSSAEEYPGRYIVIATTNVGHLSRFSEAKEWQDIDF